MVEWLQVLLCNSITIKFKSFSSTQLNRYTYMCQNAAMDLASRFPKAWVYQLEHFYSLCPVLFLPSLLQVVITLLSMHVRRLAQKESRVPAVTVRFYAREVSQEFAYVQIDSRWFKISQRYIWCLRQPYQFLTSALHARHVCVRFECPGTLRLLHSQYMICKWIFCR